MPSLTKWPLMWRSGRPGPELYGRLVLLRIRDGVGERVVAERWGGAIAVRGALAGYIALPPDRELLRLTMH